MDMIEDVQQTPFVKQLGANDRPTRDKALLSLRTYLAGRRTLPHLELLKLHKGLFYSLWMCDRPIPQQKLAASLASLLSILPRDTAVPFLRAFWQTMQREWNLIDVLRMEKFLLLVRRNVCASLEMLKEGGWDKKWVGEILDVMKEVPLNVEDMRVPMGLRFHVIDLYVDELERVGALENDEEGGKNAPLDILLEPLRELAMKSPTKTVRTKSKEALADKRLPGNTVKGELDGVNGDTNEDEWGGIEE